MTQLVTPVVEPAKDSSKSVVVVGPTADAALAPIATVADRAVVVTARAAVARRTSARARVPGVGRREDVRDIEDLSGGKAVRVDQPTRT
jgi:hypothetical protein